MGILQLPTQVPAQVGIFPNMKFMVTTDNLATITTAGYLNGVSLQSNPISSTDLLMVIYGFNEQTAAGVFGIFTVSISTTGVITLALWANPGDVILPVTPGHVAVFANANGTIEDGGVIGTAAAKAASDNAQPSLASVDGATVVGNLAMFADIGGTVEDSGVVAADVQSSANIIAGKSADIGGAGAGPLAVAVTGLTAASVVVAVIESSSNAVSVVSCAAGVDSFDITFDADPGAACIVNYVAFVAPQ